MKASRILPDTEFKTLVLRMLKELSENFNKETAGIKTHRNHKKEPVRSEDYNN